MTRKISYTPESFNCVNEIGTGKYARCGVSNAQQLSARSSSVSSNNLVNHGTWHNGQSIRVGRGYVQNDQTFDQRSSFVTSQNCMWFDVDIDKTYLNEQGIIDLHAVIKGNIGVEYIAEMIWFPVNIYKQPGDSHFEISDTEPENPYYGMVWVETEYDATYRVGDANNQRPVRVKSYTDVISYQENPDGSITYLEVAWETLSEYSGDTNIQVNNIPKILASAGDTCRFIVRAQWQMRYNHTTTPREVSLFVYSNQDSVNHLCKSPIIKFYNKPNTTLPVGGTDSEYNDPDFIPTTVPITTEEIVMEVEGGSCADIPAFNFENTMTIEVNGSLTIDHGANSNAWILAPDGLPRYLDGAGSTTIAQAGTYTILGSGEILPNTPAIIAWLTSQGYPAYDTVLTGKVEDPKFTGTTDMVSISDWGDIFIGSNIGQQMFKSVTGDFSVPADQYLVTFEETFMNCTDFTDANATLNTWLVGGATNMDRCFSGCSSFNSDISSWNVQQITTMVETFKDCVLFNQPLPWIMSSIENLQSTFEGCTNFNQPLAWDTAEVTNMTAMFKDASSFDQNINFWNVQLIPAKPTDFDTNTTPSWTFYEKPWWGSTGAPQGPFMILDILTDDVVLKYRNATNLHIFDANKQLYRKINYTYQGYREEVPLLQGLNIIFGEAGGVSLNGLNNTDTIDELTPRKTTKLKDGYRINYEHPFQQDNIDINFMSEQPRIDNFDYTDGDDFRDYAEYTFVSTIDLEYSPPNINNWGSNNQFLENMKDIFVNFWNGAFAGMGSLPTDFPTYLTFRDSDLAFTRCFESCWNLPSKAITDTWVIPNRTHFDLTGFCRWSQNCTNADDLLKRLIAQADTVDLSGAFVNTNISALDFSSNTDTTCKVTSFEGTYVHCDLNTTTGHLLNLNTSQLTSTKAMFAFANGTVGNNFVESLQMNTSSLTDMSYMFANCDVVPTNMSTSGATWNVSTVVNMTSAFMFSKFPDTIDDWNLASLGNYENTYEVSAYPQNKPYVRNTGSWGLFLGATGNPTSMTGWNLHGATEFRYDPSDWAKRGFGVDDASSGPKYVDGGIQLLQHYTGRTYPNSNYTGVYYIHDLCPAWFALTPNFNANISGWTVDYTNNTAGQVSHLRDYTFYNAQSFNQQIDWYFPPAHYVDIGFYNTNSRDLVEGNPLNDVDWSLKDTYYTNPFTQQDELPGIGVSYARNPLGKDMRTIIFSGVTPVYKWWNTFVGTPFNNGGNAIPTIMATHMASTFRNADIDSALTIRKPIWGHGHYTRLFEGTSAWTGDKQITWEMQNRIDNTDLLNPCYHSIYADRMFKNSTYNGTMTEANWKWFWYNVTNFLGFTITPEGVDEFLTGWTSLTQRNDLATEINAGNVIPNTTIINDGYWPNRPVYENTVTFTNPFVTDYGKLPQRGVFYSTDNINFPERPPTVAENDYLGGSSLPPVSRQAWCGGHIPMDSSDPNFRFPWNPAETRNLREMFAGNTTFNQDLSDFITRWAVVPGAYISTTDTWDDATYTVDSQKPYNRSSWDFTHNENYNGHGYNNFGDQYYALGGAGNKFQKPDISEATYHRTNATIDFNPSYQNRTANIDVIHHPQDFGNAAINLTTTMYPKVIFAESGQDYWYDIPTIEGKLNTNGFDITTDVAPRTTRNALPDSWPNGSTWTGGGY